MIKLINNEFKKIGLFKILISFVIFLIAIILIYEFTDNIKETIFNLIPFVGIMVSILFSGIISNEIENGTFRFYLTKPISRNKIYQSKMITIFLYTLLLILFIFFSYYVLCDGLEKDFFLKYIKYSSSLLITCCLVMMLSTLVRNTSVTVGISVLIIAFSLLITQLLLDIDFNYIEYTFFPYMDFTLFDDKITVNQMNKLYNINLSIKRGIYINIIYSIIFYKIGNYLFNKKDIKN